MKTLTCLLGPLFFSILTTSAIAGPLEDGDEAMEKRDYALALELLKPLAEAGNASAQMTVGGIYFSGLEVGQNLAAGLGWVRKAEAAPGLTRPWTMVWQNRL